MYYRYNNHATQIFALHLRINRNNVPLRNSNESEVNDILNEYLFNTFSCVDPAEYSGNMDEESADKWIKCYSSLITPEMELKIKNATGFASFEDFKKEATLEQKSSLIYSVIKNLGFNTHN